MKPHLLKVTTDPSFSFSVRQDRVPHVNTMWHYHPEIELIHFKDGNGTQFIGDSIKPFCSGDVVLLGPEIPHYWSFDDCYFEDSTLYIPDVRVAHFTEEFWGKEFLELPENQNIKSILKKARQGLELKGGTKEAVAELLEKILVASGTRRLILLIEALDLIASSQETEILSTIGFIHKHKEIQNERLNAVYQYSLKNFKRKIHVAEIAAIANMSPNSFCRYFKSKTRKTYSNFLIEIRVGIACRLLLSNNISIKEICYESGFQNFTSFHKYFKLITKKTPRAYQKQYLKDNF